MKNCFSVFVLSAFLFISGAAQAREIPQLTGPVVDEAAIFPSDIKKAVIDALIDYQKKTGVQIQVLTVKTLDGQPLEEFSIKVAEAWKIGDAKTDKGLIVLFVSKERRIRLEVGQGLEDKITDARAGRIIEYVFIPEFKKGNFAGGIVDGLNAITMALGQKINLGYVNTAPPLKRQQDIERPADVVFAVILIGLIFAFLPGIFLMSLFGGFRHFGSGRGWSSGGRTSSGGSWSGGGGGFSGGGASGSW